MSDIPTSPDDKFIITRETMDNFNEWIVEALQTRGILLDLIAELRNSTNELINTRYVADEGMDVDYFILNYVNHAEKRLKGLNNE